MKQINLVLQSKGGVGKSLFLWFVAQHEKDNKTAFIDLDESTRTSANRLADIVGESRIKHVKILNENKKLEREKILDLFEALQKSKSDNIYIDFGAPESEEFKKLLEFDISADVLKEELETMQLKLKMYVVIAGRDALASCVNYYHFLNYLVKGNFEIIALMNEGTFGGIESREAGAKMLKEKDVRFMPFGGLGESEGGKRVINLISSGSNPDTLNFASRITYKKALKQVQDIITHE